MDRDRNKKTLMELLKMNGNRECADCSAPDPDWASFTTGVFICLNCSGIHRNLPSVSRVKSVRLDFWDDDLVEFMRENGNPKAKSIYEAKVPPFYYKPRAEDCLVLREQWIRAKYEREEFTMNASQHDGGVTGNREGVLWKRGRDNGQYHKRRFILSEKDGTLKYYTKDEEIVSWFNSIRAARLYYLRKEFPNTSEAELIPRITRKYLKEGYMEKTGPKHKESFRKRWFSLDLYERKLLYFKDPVDAFEQGEVFIGSSDHGYEVLDNIPSGVRGNKWKYGITIVTPERKFVFACENEREHKEWIDAFKEVIARPMSPQDYTAEAAVQRKR
ncbi:arf-GAP with dual PH domain-containing protein 2 isoform X2 [Protopterus annectens]|uniref:arf-GAP with dual PH domain-containing protein 2 isoform X2 n=1 Tax=Protopterus annectens TaxID=7888 RepID=UPI001CF95284|nr:arf-GAP with dual PH domain-containing protein 2 isoform X2 [Protopterus annectens]